MSTPLVDLLHILLCQEDHEYDMMKIPTRDMPDSKCYYYLESDISGGDDMYDHLKWLRMTHTLKLTLRFQSDDETLEFVKEIVRISKRIRDLGDGDNIKEKFIKSILY